MYRTTELANFAGLANSHANWPIRRFFMKLTILVIIVFGVLTGLTYGSVSPKAGLAVATSPSPLVNPMLYTTIGQSILLETAFLARIDVDTLITQCFIQLLDSLFYPKLHS
jgi:hypothetical protein